VVPEGRRVRQSRGAVQPRADAGKERGRAPGHGASARLVLSHRAGIRLRSSRSPWLRARCRCGEDPKPPTRAMRSPRDGNREHARAMRWRAELRCKPGGTPVIVDRASRRRASPRGAQPAAASTAGGARCPPTVRRKRSSRPGIAVSLGTSTVSRSGSTRSRSRQEVRTVSSRRHQGRKPRTLPDPDAGRESAAVKSTSTPTTRRYRSPACRRSSRRRRTSRSRG
jgi:hypothetical protein